MTDLYSVIIVGAGIAGLRVGIEILKKKTNIKCCILEKYGYVGGRVVTFHKNIPKVGEVQWENGAGRISFSHKKILKLLYDYNLTFVQLDDATYFVNDPSVTGEKPIITGNTFSDLIDVYLGPIQNLSPQTLATHTLKELLDKIHGSGASKEFYIQFPYWSEIHTLRADIALDAFKHEMSSNKNFGVCQEGLSSLTHAMMMEFISRGGKIIMDTEVLKVKNNLDKSISLECKLKGQETTKTFVSKITVLALHQEAVKHIDGVNKLPVLKHLEMTPLLRIYAVFPTKKNVSWFSGLDKIVTDSPVRYIIPINQQKGVIMISYTDGADAKQWINMNDASIHGEDNVKDLIMTEVRKLFPERTIPDPIFFKQHPWYEGCTYWLPGNYKVEDASYDSLQPLPSTIPNLFMCGESFAVRQCWMESALDQADKLLSHLQFNLAFKKL
jgi:hypothetical protein